MPGTAQAGSEADPHPRPPLRIANCSGFYGDRLSAAREMVDGGPIDVLTGDYLAELTMFILWRQRRKDATAGYARTFLAQMEHVLGTCADRGIRVVTNAGGLNPAALADRLRELAGRLGLVVSVAHVEGDDLLPRLDGLRAAGHALRHLDTGRPLADAAGEVLTANAYLGAWPVVEALAGGADVVVCPRVTDASLVVGPAAWHHGWEPTDWDRLAGAVAAGHVIECGPQACGGNYAFFGEVPGLEHPGFPIAEVAGDGSAVITKHPGSGGAVTVGTVTAQLLYEIAGPAYPNTDVVARFDTLALDGVGPDRVRISGTAGLPAPADVKVCINLAGGYRNTMTFVLGGLDVEQKADLVTRSLARAVGGRERFAGFDAHLARTDRPDAPSEEEASALLHVTVTDPDPDVVGRAFSSAATALTLSSVPGLHLTTPPGDASPFGVYWPALLPATEVEPVVVHADGRRVAVCRRAPAPGPAGLAAPAGTTPPPFPAPPPGGRPGGDRGTAPPPGLQGAAGHLTGLPAPVGPADPLAGPSVRVPLGTVIGARSGDKGGNANVGFWARSDEAWAWLAAYLTVERFRLLLPEAGALAVHRHELANLRALNFVVDGLLGEGVASSTRTDPQAKGLGEYLRSRLVDLPTRLCNRESEEASGGLH